MVVALALHFSPSDHGGRRVLWLPHLVGSGTGVSTNPNINHDLIQSIAPCIQMHELTAGIVRKHKPSFFRVAGELARLQNRFLIRFTRNEALIEKRFIRRFYFPS
jgi:hypothetical protein